MSCDHYLQINHENDVNDVGLDTTDWNNQGLTITNQEWSVTPDDGTLGITPGAIVTPYIMARLTPVPGAGGRYYEVRGQAIFNNGEKESNTIQIYVDH